jgi:hypothetical protein
MRSLSRKISYKRWLQKDVRARGLVETRNQPYPVPGAGGLGEKYRLVKQMFGTRYQTLLRKQIKQALCRSQDYFK